MKRLQAFLKVSHKNLGEKKAWLDGLMMKIRCPENATSQV